MLSMGIKERKEKHREELKEQILTAAKRLFMKFGYEATSIRKIAAEIEFSPTTIYLYYKDKSDIIYALHQEGFKLLSGYFTRHAVSEHPFERLKAMGEAYLKFALENREFYELMFIMREPLSFIDAHADPGDAHCWPEGQNVFNGLVATLLECQRAGYFKGQDPEALALLVWSAVHGMCSLTVHGHLEFIAKSRDRFADGLESLQASFGNFVLMLEKMK